MKKDKNGKIIKEGNYLKSETFPCNLLYCHNQHYSNEDTFRGSDFVEGKLVGSTLLITADEDELDDTVRGIEALYENNLRIEIVTKKTKLNEEQKRKLKIHKKIFPKLERMGIYK